MLKTRYEEFPKAKDALPFVLKTGIVKTLENCGNEANWHENPEIQLCTRGAGFVLINGEKYDVAVNDMVVVNSDLIHYTGSPDSLEYTCLIIDAGFCRELGIDPASLLFEPHFQSGPLLRLLEALEETYTNTCDVCRTARLRGIVTGILIELREKHTLAINPASGKASSGAAQNAIRFIRENYNRKLSLDEIAKYVLTDKYSLSREFKRLTKQTVVEYINRYRCGMAIDYIRDGETVSNAALLCGFNNMSFFTRIFKRYIGKLPSDIRD